MENRKSGGASELETLRLLRVFVRISDPQQRREVIAHAEVNLLRMSGHLYPPRYRARCRGVWRQDVVTTPYGYEEAIGQIEACSRGEGADRRKDAPHSRVAYHGSKDGG